MELKTFSSRSLLTIMGAAQQELMARGLVRSANNPVGDFAELAVATALNLEMAPKSNRGYDAIHANGTRYEIKGRRLMSGNRSEQVSAIRGIETHPFDLLAAVVFEADYTVIRAMLVPVEVVDAYSTNVAHTNSRRFMATAKMLNVFGVEDITDVVATAFDTLFK